MIDTLTIADFRNHKSSRIKTGGAKNIIITGPNGSGKTAILESISMMSGGSGLRGAAACDIARFGTPGFAVVANLFDGTDISVSWQTDAPRRNITIDGDAANLSDLSDTLRIVWITPKEDRLFVEGVSDRRAFLDRMAASFDSAHNGRTARLAKLLSERAFALKSGANDNWLSPIERAIAETAVAVSATRLQYAAEINYFLDKGNKFARHESGLSLSGWFEDRLASCISASDIEMEYIEYLAANRALIADKMNILGAHRSDFGMFNKTLNLSAHLTSTGQQKSVLLSWMIAHAKLINARAKKSPIILLDEAVAHLDSDARAALFKELAEADATVWATGIDAELYKDVPDALFVACNNGEINYKIKI